MIQTPEDKIEGLCFTISAWVTRRGRATLDQKKLEFENADRNVKTYILELKNLILLYESQKNNA